MTKINYVSEMSHISQLQIEYERTYQNVTSLSGLTNVDVMNIRAGVIADGAKCPLDINIENIDNHDISTKMYHVLFEAANAEMNHTVFRIQKKILEIRSLLSGDDIDPDDVIDVNITKYTASKIGSWLAEIWMFMQNQVEFVECKDKHIDNAMSAAGVCVDCLFDDLSDSNRTYMINRLYSTINDGSDKMADNNLSELCVLIENIHTVFFGK